MTISPWLAALALLVGFSGATYAVNRRLSRDLPKPPAHERSSAILGAVHGLSLTAGVVFPLIGRSTLPIPTPVAWGAVGAMAAAYGLQLWAMVALAGHFTLSLTASEDQPVIDRGPYRFVRHPGYLAQLLLWLSFALATRDAPTLLFVALAAPLAYAHRIRVEETLLVAALAGRYEAYARGRARLLPGVW